MNLYKYLFNLKIAFCAWPATVLSASEKDPPGVNIMPWYLN